MAEALARHLLPESVTICAAGIVAHGMNPNVAQVMAEVDISLEGHYSKSKAELSPRSWDLVITVCDNAADACPTIPAKRVIHNPFPDPPALAAECTEPEEKLNCYRRVRDQIGAWLNNQNLLEQAQ